MKGGRRRKILLAIGFSILCTTVIQSAAADWPTYRGDNHRSGISEEDVKLPLQAAWIHQPARAPHPAWPEMPATVDVYRHVRLGPTVILDRAYHVAVAGKSLYYGSSADDCVYCLDVATGEVRWSFCTEGPVRLAPAVAGGRVYAGSDDGWLYCLDAADGALVWKHRAGPADHRLPGNGRMISLWPVRCGIVVDGPAVYCCAGLFPSQGTYLCALNAADGRAIWKQQVDVSAQGYLVGSPSRLYVPTGRTPPHIYDRTGGEQIAPFPGKGQQRSGCPEGGGCYAVLVDDLLVHGGGETGGMQVINARSREKLISTAGTRMLAKGPIAYILRNDRLCALDRAHYLELTRLEQKKKKTPEDEKRIAELGGDSRAYLKWEVPCASPYELIMAGGTIFAGGGGRVVAYGAADGKQLWSGEIMGTAYGLAVCGGRLFASTDQGLIYCFAPGPGPKRAAIPRTIPRFPEDPTPEPFAVTLLYERAAQTAIEAAGTAQGGPAKGYCLVLDSGIGRLAFEIATRSIDLHTIGVEPDAAKVAAARLTFRRARQNGILSVIHHGTSDRLPYQKNFANLITSEACLTTGQLPGSAAEVSRLLRPSGGVAVFVAPAGKADREAWQQWGNGTIPGWKVEETANGLLVGSGTRGPLEGAGEWTHFFADSGNSASSGDALRFGPVDVQWFGRPGPRKMVDRHEKNVAPLVKDGRLFISGNNYLVTLDAYNGALLWQRDLPESIRLGAFKNCGSMAVAEKRLYVASADRCTAFDVQTGQPQRTFSLPDAESGKAEWGYVAAVDELLFGSATRPGATFRVQDIPTQDLIWRDFQPVVCSDSLFAFDRQTGRKLWTHEPTSGVIINPTIAVGGGRIYFVESVNPETRDVADGRIKLDLLLDQGSYLIALDMRTGETLWEKPAGLEALEHVIFLSYAKETVLITGTKNVPVGEKERVRYDLSAFDAASGERLWQSTETPKPDHILQGPHGEQVQHSAIVGNTVYNTGIACNLRTGKPIDGWRWQKSDKCGTISASASCLFSRYSNPRMFRIAGGESMALTQVTRPGCWINMIPASGLILIPEASSGCTCYYSIQTSLALAPREAEGDGRSTEEGERP